MVAGISGGDPHGVHEAGGRRALDPRGQVLAPPDVFSVPNTLKYSRKNHHTAQTRVLARFAVIFDLLTQSFIHETVLGDCSSVCNSSNGPISFCSSALFIANFCCLGDPVLELACQIYVVKSSFNARYGL